MNMIKIVLITIALLVSSNAVSNEIAVIVHPSNNANLDSSSISRIFLGKMKSFPGGGSAIAINQIESSTSTKEFNSKVLKRSSSQLKAYWSKLLFTGKGTPPKTANTDVEVAEMIAANPSLIGYIDASAVTGDVKIIATF